MTVRDFAGFFVAQFLGALNDNLVKNAAVVMILFRIAGDAPFDPAVAVSLAAAVFVAPFFLLSGTAGELADRFDPARLARLLKGAEIAVATLVAAGFLLADAWILLAAVFAMGCQSAMFGPLKYSALPRLVAPTRLNDANAWVEASTFVAIVGGTVLGGGLMALADGPVLAAAAAPTLAVLGAAAALLMPRLAPARPALRLSRDPLALAQRTVRAAAGLPAVFPALLALAWFWFAGVAYLAQLPTYVRDVVGGDELSASLFAALFALGVGLGAWVSARRLRGEISSRLAPAGALIVGLSAAALWALAAFQPTDQGGLGFAEALARPAGWASALALTALAFGGGLFATPLMALVQARAPETARARTIAAGNILSAAAMTLSAGGAAALLAAGLRLDQLFGVLAVLALAAAGLARVLEPAAAKRTARGIFRLAFGLEARGLEHVEAAGERAVIAPNHASFLDGALLAAVLPGRPLFAVNAQIARRWWVRPFLALVDAVQLGPGSALGARKLARAVAAGRHLVIFPEGRITTTGGLMKAYPGPAVIPERADAPVVPVAIRGAERSLLSRLAGKVKRVPFPQISLDAAPARRLEIPDDLRGPTRRRASADALHDAMSETMFETENLDATLWHALLWARRLHGRDVQILSDPDGEAASYDRLLLGALALGRRIAARTEPGERVGVMLPSSRGAAIAVFALLAFGRRPCMLNFTGGRDALQGARDAAGFTRVLTSRHFLEKAGLDGLAQALEADLAVDRLEDLRAEIGPGRLLRARLDLTRADRFGAGAADDEAVVLFTSGSEGRPKGYRSADLLRSAPRPQHLDVRAPFV